MSGGGSVFGEPNLDQFGKFEDSSFVFYGGLIDSRPVFFNLFELTAHYFGKKIFCGAQVVKHCSRSTECDVISGSDICVTLRDLKGSKF